jgi:hypothetical protein
MSGLIPPVFDYETFVALSGPELVAYVEPLLNDQSTSVSAETIARISLDLPSYDEYHLVYALELGALHAPETFARHVPEYLAREEASVCLAAVRALSRLPDESINEELLDLVRHVPIGRHLLTQPINGARHIVGTNSPLVKQLLADLTNRLDAKTGD